MESPNATYVNNNNLSLILHGFRDMTDYWSNSPSPSTEMTLFNAFTKDETLYNRDG